MDENEFYYSISVNTKEIYTNFDRLYYFYDIIILGLGNTHVYKTTIVSKKIPFYYLIKRISNKIVSSMLDDGRHINNKEIFDILIKENILNIYSNMFNHSNILSNENK